MINNVIIGTAGHIDHGKTTLIKALSGKDTDTTVEEKERGISINLGFAYFDLPSGKRCGVVDVPGHEKFIKNMLAGVSGINLVLLLIDAREGIMPQTKEHIDILTLLGIQNYIIVMTKIDLVDEEFRELVKDDIEEFIKDTQLENSPIVQVDSISGKGIKELLNVIDKKTEEVTKISSGKNARLNIDRVFQVKGFGTVVTGTLIEGVFSIGDELTIYPKNINTKIRNLQVHEQNVEKAYAGQRTAVNLSNVRMEDIGRGCTLATPKSMIKTYMVDTEIKMVKDAKYNLKLWDRVRVYTGTEEVMARVVPLGRETIEENETGFVQLRLEEEIAVKNYDKFIIRNYSPMITIGGGTILDAKPKKHRRFNAEILDKLKSQSGGNIKDLISNYMLSTYNYVISEKEIKDFIQQEKNIISENINLLLEEKEILKTNTGYIHMKKYEEIHEKTYNIVLDYHKRYKFKKGIPKIEMSTKIKINQKELLDIIDLFVYSDTLKLENGIISSKKFVVKYTDNEKREKDRMEAMLLENKFSPPSISEITKNNKINNEMLEAMIGDTIIRLDDNIIINRLAYEEAKNKIIDYCKKNGKITLAEFRDIINSSRKYAVAILDYTDKQGITKRVEDYRILEKNI